MIFEERRKQQHEKVIEFIFKLNIVWLRITSLCCVSMNGKLSSIIMYDSLCFKVFVVRQNKKDLNFQILAKSESISHKIIDLKFSSLADFKNFSLIRLSV